MAPVTCLALTSNDAFLGKMIELISFKEIKRNYDL